MEPKRLFPRLASLVIFTLALPACTPILAETPAAGEPVVEELAAEASVTQEPAVEETTQTPITEAPVEEPTAENPANPKIITFAWTQEPDSLNMAYSNRWYASVLAEVFACKPWLFDENNEPFPYLLAELPTVSADGRVVTMELRDDIFWSDGVPITAGDFIFTYEMINTPANAVDWVYPFDLFRIEAPDPKTVKMTFTVPFTPWVSTLWTVLLPRHILQPEFDSVGSLNNAAWNLAPTVGCGPFSFRSWEPGSYIRFERNENFWGTPARSDAVVFQIVSDDAAQTAATLAGDTDIAFWPPYEDIPAFRDAGLEVATQASGYNEGWFFNLRPMASSGIKDLAVRQAIAMALNREANTDIRLGVVSPNKTFFEALPAYVSPDISPWQYDPEGARDLLASSGYIDRDGDGIREDKEGNPLRVTLGSTRKDERQNYQVVARQQLLEVGIDLQVTTYADDLFFTSFTADGPAAGGVLDIMQWSDAPAFPDPDVPYWLCSELASEENPWGYNYFVCDETLDALFQQQLVTVDPAARIAIFHEITQYLHDNVYYLGIWEDPDVWIVNPRVSGYKFSGVTPFFNIAEWDLTP